MIVECEQLIVMDSAVGRPVVIDEGGDLEMGPPGSATRPPGSCCVRIKPVSYMLGRRRASAVRGTRALRCEKVPGEGASHEALH